MFTAWLPWTRYNFPLSVRQKPARCLCALKDSFVFLQQSKTEGEQSPCPRSEAVRPRGQTAFKWERCHYNLYFKYVNLSFSYLYFNLYVKFLVGLQYSKLKLIIIRCRKFCFHIQGRFLIIFQYATWLADMVRNECALFGFSSDAVFGKCWSEFGESNLKWTVPPKSDSPLIIIELHLKPFTTWNTLSTKINQFQAMYIISLGSNSVQSYLIQIKA